MKVRSVFKSASSQIPCCLLLWGRNLLLILESERRDRETKGMDINVKEETWHRVEQILVK